ncbi:MAG: hypothetical protein PHF60_00855 [Candidatus ainarchaeum sp.]|nr:hypothetical protein [Candidatus ainarchaeum sp.]
MLSQGCSKPVQEILASRLARRFGTEMLALHRVAILASILCARNHLPYEDFRKAVSPDAVNLFRIREIVSDVLVSGAVPSTEAQLSLTPLFHHILAFDKEHSHLDPHLPRHLRRLVECDTLSTSARFDLVKNLTEVDCIPCNRMLSLHNRQR